MVIPIQSQYDKAPPPPPPPSAPDQSPEHRRLLSDEQAIRVELNHSESILVTGPVLRNPEFLALLDRRREKLENGVLRLHQLNKEGFDMFLSHLNNEQVNLLALCDALIAFETSYHIGYVPLGQLAVEHIQKDINHDNVNLVLCNIAPIDWDLKTARKLGNKTDQMKMFEELVDRLLDRCRKEKNSLDKTKLNPSSPTIKRCCTQCYGTKGEKKKKKKFWYCLCRCWQVVFD